MDVSFNFLFVQYNVTLYKKKAQERSEKTEMLKLDVNTITNISQKLYYVNLTAKEMFSLLKSATFLKIIYDAPAMKIHYARCNLVRAYIYSTSKLKFFITF